MTLCNRRRTSPLVIAFLSIASMAVFVAPGAAAQSPPRTTPGSAAAKAWLESVDTGKYSQAWDLTASDAKKLVSRTEWERIFLTERRALGKVISRKLVQSRPHADSDVVIFKTSFEKQESGAEMLMLMRDPDGRWRVLAYELL